MRPSDFEIQILDLIVDGDSSFAALYVALGRVSEHLVDVDMLLSTLKVLEARGFVRASQMEQDGSFRPADAADFERAAIDYTAWLSDVSARDAAIDEVGLWIQITDAGRHVWSSWSGGATEAVRWMLDMDVKTQIVEVRAQSLSAAEAALVQWLDVHHELEEIHGTRRSSAIPEFVLRDGTTILGGVLLSCRFGKSRH